MHKEGRVFFETEPFLDLIAHCIRRGNPNLGICLEVHGYLIGYNKEQDIFITKAIPIKHGSTTYVRLQGEDYVIAAESIEKNLMNNEFVVGWYHSHPNLPIFLSEDDKRTTSQMWEKSIAVVVNPFLIQKLPSDPKIAFIKCFRLENPTASHLAYYEIPLVLPQLSLSSVLVQTLKWVTNNTLGKALSPEACEKEEDRELSQALSILFKYLTQRSKEPQILEEVQEKMIKLEEKIENLQKTINELRKPLEEQKENQKHHSSNLDPFFE